MDIKKRHMLIAKISKEMENKGLILSKMSLHGLIYLLSELFSVSSGYKFELFTYGPYSVELTSDLDYLSSLKVIDIEYINNDSYIGSKITPGPVSGEILEVEEKFLKESVDKIKRIVKLFGSNTARELETKSTIVYLRKKGIDKSDVVEKVKEIKPYLKEEEIYKGLSDLASFV